MKCWVEGSECRIHNENYEFGVLNIIEGFCQGCYNIGDNCEIIGGIIKNLLIEFQEKPLISESDQDNLYDRAEIILEALRMLEKKRKKKIAKAMKAGKEERARSLKDKFNDIRELKRFFKKLSHTQE